MIKDFKRRLDRLEQQNNNLSDYYRLVPYLEKKSNYSLLPDDIKSLYCNYIGVDRETMEKMDIEISGNTDFIIDFLSKDKFNSESASFKESLLDIERIWDEI